MSRSRRRQPGDTIKHARAKFQEAMELLFETDSPAKRAERLHGEIDVTTLKGGGWVGCVVSDRQVRRILPEHGFAQIRQRAITT